MEIHLPPEQEAHLAAIAASTGRTTHELVQEAIELWEREQARALAEFRKSLDDAEDSIARGEGIDINPGNDAPAQQGCHGALPRARRAGAQSRALMAYRLAKKRSAFLS